MTQAQSRDLWAAIHRYAGLSGMAFLILAAVTGCLLCFAQPLDRALNRDLFVRPAASAPLEPLAVVEAFRTRHPELQVTGFPLTLGPADTVPVTVAPAPGGPAIAQNQLFLDAEGRVAGARSQGPGWGRRGLVAGLYQFHFTLLAGKWGRWLMGVAALSWLLSNLVGVYLTWPRRPPYLKAWKRMWQVSAKSALPRLLLDLHRATGLWLLIGLTVLAFTSVCLNFYSEAYEPTVLRIAPLKHTLFDQPAPFPAGARPSLGFDDAVRLGRAHAAAEKVSWRPATALYRPDWNLYGVTFSSDGRLNYRRLGPIYYYFDARDGHFVHVVDPYSDSAGLVMIRILYPLHSGQVGGWPTVALVFLLGLATVEQSVTGFWVWWKKRRIRQQGRAAQRAAAARLAQAQRAGR